METEETLGEIPDEFLDPIQVKHVQSFFILVFLKPLPPITCWIIMIPQFNKMTNELDANKYFFYFFSLQYTLMKNLVILASSRITIDRPVIQWHLLSDVVHFSLHTLIPFYNESLHLNRNLIGVMWIADWSVQPISSYWCKILGIGMKFYNSGMDKKSSN